MGKIDCNWERGAVWMCECGSHLKNCAKTASASRTLALRFEDETICSRTERFLEFLDVELEKAVKKCLSKALVSKGRPMSP